MTPTQFIKKTLVIACCLLTVSAGVSAADGFTINEKLLKAFQQTFPDATQVKWLEEPTGYQVTFMQNNILTKVEYDKEGHFVGSLRYYSEKNLPVTVIWALQKKFAGKTVWGVTEHSSETGTEYYIKLVDDTNWYTVSCDADGNMQVVEKYKKS